VSGGGEGGTALALALAAPSGDRSAAVGKWMAQQQQQQPPPPPLQAERPQSPLSGGGRGRAKLPRGDAEAAECAALVGVFLALGGRALNGAADASVGGWETSKGWAEAAHAAEGVATALARQASGGKQAHHGRTAKLSAASQVTGSAWAFP
jgi:hypothetical protein